MPYGYRFLESFWNRSNKEKFLKEKLNEKEKFRYWSLDFTVKIGFFIYGVYFIILTLINKKLVANYLVILLGLTAILGSLIRQEYRTIKLIKYGYLEKNPLLKNKIIRILWIVVIHVLTVIGLIYLILFLKSI